MEKIEKAITPAPLWFFGGFFCGVVFLIVLRAVSHG
jgi:hypothetical protein